MNKKLRALLEKRAGIVAEARVLADSSDILGDDDQLKYDAMMTELETIAGSIERENNLIAVESTVATTPAPLSAARVSAPELTNDPKGGFKSYGQFVQAVHASSAQNVVDERLLITSASPSVYGNEGAGSDGGFLVPTEFSTDIFSTSLEGDALLPLTDNINISSNGMSFPKDETTPWGSNGIRAYWDGEASAATETKPVLGTNSLRLKKLVALVPVTDELLSDAPAMGAYVSSQSARSIRWKTNDAIINGTGVGMPEGITKSAAIVAQPKEGSQTAKTIVKENIAKMFGRMPAGSLMTSVWLINNDAFHQLITMNIGNSLIWMPPTSGMAGPVGGTLLGRPVFVTQSCQTLGSLNDIMLVDLSQYRTITKAGGIETATSMHLYFDAGAMAFRSTFRMDGQSSVASSFSPANGTVKLSPFVSLAVRA